MKRRHRARRSVALFFRRLLHMATQPIFLVLTVCGNAVILGSAVGLYVLEAHVNPRITSLLDPIWWAVSTVTTVGYGDVTPITPAGRILGLVTMILGTALFWSYTALFAEAIVSQEIVDVEMELHSLAATLERLSRQAPPRDEETRKWIRDLQSHLSRRPS